jgi:hypothetical protein
LKKNGITPILVFDGAALHMKAGVEIERERRRGEKR